MPKKRFHYEEFPNITLKEAGLFPKAALVVVRPDKDPNDLKRGTGTIADAKKGDGECCVWVVIMIFNLI